MLRLIFSNIEKHKLLYFLMGVMFFVLAFYLLIGLNILSTIDKSLTKAVIDNMSGDLIIVPKEVKKIDLITKDGEKKLYRLENPDTVLAFLDRREDVIAAAPRVRIWGMLRTDRNLMPVILVGVDPAREKMLLPGRTMDEGDWLTGGPQVCLFYRHSDYLSASLGEQIAVNAVTEAGYQNMDVAELKGILTYNELDYYTDYALFGFIPLDFLHQLRQSSESFAGEIVVRLSESGKFKDVSEALESTFPGKYNFIPPHESSSLVFGVSTLSKFGILLVASVLVLMVLLCSGFLISISIESRRMEIGIYQAIGIRNSTIGLLMGGELLFVIFLFGFLGIFAGNLFIGESMKDGIQATIIPLNLILGRKLTPVVTSFSANLWVITLLVLVFCGNLLYSIRKLGQLNPIDVLREV